MMDYKIVNGFLTPQRCQELIDLSEAMGYVDADISFPEGPRMIPSYRNNLRCLHRDEHLRMELETAMHKFIFRELTFENREWYCASLSGDFRFYKYLTGHFFKKHRDGIVRTDEGTTLVTVLIYLNTVEDGGGTLLCDKALEAPCMVQPSY